jgi:polar amino acid transport system permease protein
VSGAHLTAVPPTERSTEHDPSDADAIVAVPQRHWGRAVAAVLVIGFVAFVIVTAATSKNVQWGQVRYYLFYSTILKGSLVTIKLTLLSMLGGVAVGVVGALMRLSPSRVLRTVSGVYVWLFRGTPLLVQVIFWYNLALFVPRLGVGSVSVPTNSVMTSFVAALVALILNCGAYMTEIVRGGLLAVDRGQSEAAVALGLSNRSTVTHIVLPQALRVIVPTMGNQLIGLLKDTSLVSVIAAQELLTQAQIIYSRTYLVIELLIVASFWYLVMTTVVMFAQRQVEARLNISLDTTGANAAPNSRASWTLAANRFVRGGLR